MMRSRWDLRFLGAVLALVGIGIVMLSSASSVLAFERFGDSYFFVKRQLFFGVFPGFILAALIQLIPVGAIRRLALPLYAASLLLLVAVFIPGIGEHLDRANRWIALGPVLLQPSELVKLTSIMYAGAWLSGTQKTFLVRWKEHIFPYLAIVTLPVFLVVLQPDLGTSIVIIAVLMAMLFLSGPRLGQCLAMIAGAIALLAVAVVASPYRLERFLTFIEPGRDVQGSSYHIQQALVAISSGGLFGSGLGKSVQKFQYLPEVASDSLFAIMAEELGVVMIGAITLLLFWVAARCFTIASAQEDVFARFVSIGVGTWLAVQAVVNIGANVGLIPFTGVPLPLVSHGGTAMMSMLVGLGIVFSFSRRPSHAPSASRRVIVRRGL